MELVVRIAEVYHGELAKLLPGMVNWTIVSLLYCQETSNHEEMGSTSSIGRQHAYLARKECPERCQNSCWSL